MSFVVNSTAALNDEFCNSPSFIIKIGNFTGESRSHDMFTMCSYLHDEAVQ